MSSPTRQASIQLLETKPDHTFELIREGGDPDRVCNRKDRNLYHNHRSANGAGDRACVRLHCIANRRAFRNAAVRSCPCECAHWAL